MERPKSTDISTPRFFGLLNDEDQAGYVTLKSQLSAPGTRNRRGKRLESFAEYLETIRSYCLRNDDDDWKRCLVCGVCWAQCGIAINTRQLRLLIDKCKSSINGSLHKMGYSTSSCRGDTSSALIEKLPILKGNFSELRQWTVRQQSVSTPQPAQLSSSMIIDDDLQFLQQQQKIQQLQQPTTPEINLTDSFDFALLSAPLIPATTNSTTTMTTAMSMPAMTMTMTMTMDDSVPSAVGIGIGIGINGVGGGEIDSDFFNDPMCLPMSSWLEKDPMASIPSPHNFTLFDLPEF